VTTEYHSLRAELAERERAFVFGVMLAARGAKARAARMLGVSRYTLGRTLVRLGLVEEKPEAKDAAPVMCRNADCGNEVPPSRWVGLAGNRAGYCSAECRRYAGKRPSRRRFNNVRGRSA
jgi:hypothetical protein